MDYEAAYRELHKSDKIFRGNLTDHAIARIKELVDTYGTREILDFGSGKGVQYLGQRAHEAWGVLPYCYDPGVGAFATMPEKQFGGIICTNVMEHIAEEDLMATFHLLFSKLEKTESAWVYFEICTRTSRKMLPDGRSVHLTVRPPEWWMDVIRGFRPPDAKVIAIFTE